MPRQCPQFSMHLNPYEPLTQPCFLNNKYCQIVLFTCYIERDPVLFYCTCMWHIFELYGINKLCLFVNFFCSYILYCTNKTYNVCNIVFFFITIIFQVACCDLYKNAFVVHVTVYLRALHKFPSQPSAHPVKQVPWTLEHSFMSRQCPHVS